MKRVGQIATALLLLSILLLPSLNCENTDPDEKPEIQKQGKAFRYSIQGWIYLHIEGEPYERGYQYGFLAAEEIADSILRWKEYIKNQYEKNKVDFLKIRVLLKNKDMDEIWESYKDKATKIFLEHVPEEYIKEMEGIVEGIKDRGIKISGREIEFEDILLIQFVQDTHYVQLHPQKRLPFLTWLGAKLSSYARPIGDKLYDIIIRLAGFSIKKFLSPREFEHKGHCSAFIATGDYTTDGEIVAAHSTIFGAIIAERCNLILNVKPSEGNSFTMTTFPGSLWSQEDWYQNEKGIILTETELRQGPYSLKGTPKGIRSRSAIQYSDSIDEVINILQQNNNGLIPNEWLIGDKKTGEIASLEQAYYNTPIKRTNSGFYWSANVPHDETVLLELWGGFNSNTEIKKMIYQTYSMNRNIKFEEIKTHYYGKINVETAKEILSTNPICNLVTDGKITSSNLMENNGFEVYLGNPNGTANKISKENEQKYEHITDQPGTGWLEIYNPKIECNEIDTSKKVISDYELATADLVWNFGTDSKNDFCFCPIIKKDSDILVGLSNGQLKALSKDSGCEKWNINIEGKILDIKTSGKNIILGTSKGIKVINDQTKAKEWEILTDKSVYSISNIYKNKIFAGCKDGSLYAIDSTTGLIEWSHSFDESVYVSNIGNEELYFASGNKCYSVNFNGKIKWSFKTDGVITSPPEYKDGKVFFGSWDHNIYCLDAKDGSKIWSFETEWGIDSTPEIAKNQVFVGGLDNNLYALDEKTGKLNWFYNCEAAIHSTPLSYGEYVFFGCDDGRVYALDKKTGEKIWTFAPAYKNSGDINNYLTTPILSDVVVDDGVLYFGVNDNVFALDAQTFKEEKTEKEELIIRENLVFLIVLLVFLGVSLLIYSYYLNRKNQK